jgi:hypothetical protein
MGWWRVLEDVALADCPFDLEGSDLDDLFDGGACLGRADGRFRQRAEVYQDRHRAASALVWGSRFWRSVVLCK